MTARLLTVLWTVLLLPLAVAEGAEGACVENLQIFSEHDARIVTLTWDATGGASFYDVHITLDGGSSEHLAVVAGDTLTFVHTDAPEGVLSYRVAADGHPSDECPSVDTHIGGEQPEIPEPSCVEALAVEARGDGSLRLSWAPTAGAETYDVLRATGKDPLVPYRVLGGSLTSFDDESVDVGTTYRYAVVADGLRSDCEAVEATAIPFFPIAVAGVIGLVGALIAVSAVRSRR